MKTKKSESNSSPELPVNNEYLLRLYVTMHTSISIMAQTHLKNICERQMKGDYEIELINLLRSPQLPHDHRILPITKLVFKLPEPLRNIIEDLSERDNVLVGMDLISRS